MTREESRETLLCTARAEFLRHGFDGTDVNRIARRSGVAPTTFYRWFKDKTEIFLAVHRAWEAQEQASMQRLLARRGPLADMVQACVDHHRRDRPFRLSLNRLGLEDPRVRQALAASRLDRLGRLQARLGEPRPTRPELALDLLMFESLATTLAEAQLGDMGVDDGAARRQLGEILARWRSEPVQAANDPVAEMAGERPSARRT